MKPDRQKIIQDWLLATQDTIYVLQQWAGRLESWQGQSQVEAAEFGEACQQLREAGLGAWANDAGGHGLSALAQALESAAETSAWWQMEADRSVKR
jgi:hypothetical protein